MCLYDHAHGETFTDEEYTAFKAGWQTAFEFGGEAMASSRFKVRTDVRSANYGPNAMNNPPWGLMLHHTAGDERSDIPTLTRPGTGVSSNDYINKQGVVFELVPFPRRAWHAGARDASRAGRYFYDGNTYYWGIEIENYGNGRDPYPRVQIDAVVWRCRQLRKRWPNIDHPEQIFRHRDFSPSRKVDPSNNFPFEEVRRRIMAASDPTDDAAPIAPAPKPETPPAPEPAPVPNSKEFSDYEEADIPRSLTLTLKGVPKALIRPYSAPTEPEKPPTPAPAPEPVPEPVPEPPADPRKDAAVRIINSYFGTSHGTEIYEEADRAGLHLAAACALVEQESNGRNIFGCDLGPRTTVPFCRQEVTKERVQQLVRHIRAGGTSNGVGLTQLTWRDFIYEAESLGGAHIPRNQLRVGFKLLASYIERYGEPDCWGAYNAGERNRASVRATYSTSCMRKRDAWRQRLSGVLSNGQEEDVANPEPRPEPPEWVNEPQPEPEPEPEPGTPGPVKRRIEDVEPALVRAYVAAAVQLLGLLGYAQITEEHVDAITLLVLGLIPLVTITAGHLTRARVSPAAPSARDESS